tara:strand:+ start:1463 stop:1822 length:360 start_codon:yes stop_codon:yes gene_type:complete
MKPLARVEGNGFAMRFSNGWIVHANWGKDAHSVETDGEITSFEVKVLANDSIPCAPGNADGVISNVLSGWIGGQTLQSADIGNEVAGWVETDMLAEIFYLASRGRKRKIRRLLTEKPCG